MSKPTKEWWDRILSYGSKRIDKKEQSTCYYVPNPEVIFDITLPLGTSFHVVSSNETVFGDQKVLLGILGELEKIIFELKDRVLKIEGALAVSGFKPEP